MRVVDLYSVKGKEIFLSPLKSLLILSYQCEGLCLLLALVQKRWASFLLLGWPGPPGGSLMGPASHDPGRAQLKLHGCL